MADADANVQAGRDFPAYGLACFVVAAESRVHGHRGVPRAPQVAA